MLKNASLDEKNIPLQNRVLLFILESVRLVEVTHAWKPHFYHQHLHVFLSLTHV
jgi:hypothetical protein